MRQNNEIGIKLQHYWLERTHILEPIHLRKCSLSPLLGFNGDLRPGGRQESNSPAEIGEIEPEK